MKFDKNVLKIFFYTKNMFLSRFSVIKSIQKLQNLLFFLDSRIWRGGRSNPVSGRARCVPWQVRPDRRRRRQSRRRRNFRTKENLLNFLNTNYFLNLQFLKNLLNFLKKLFIFLTISWIFTLTPRHPASSIVNFLKNLLIFLRISIFLRICWFC